MIALKGILTAKTPFMIGSGESEGSDVDILRNKLGEVFIPGTSLAGVCRDYLEEVGIETKYVFGYGATKESSDEKESSIIFYDAFSKGNVYTAVRDAVRLERKVSKTGCKFDFEIAESKSDFDFRMEINYHDPEMEKVICENIVSGFKKEVIKIGAKTTRGFGVFDLKNVKHLKLNLNDKKDMKKYINFTWEDVKDDFTFKDDKRELYIFLEDKFALDSFIFIRDYATVDRIEPDNDSKFVDAKTLTNNHGDVVIPGTAWAGVFRHHMGKILDKVKYGNKVEFLDELFGYQKKDEDGKDAIKSKSKIFFPEMTISSKNITLLNRTRTAVDRFSGSALQTGALFTGRVAYKKEESSTAIYLKVQIKKDFTELELAKSLVLRCFEDLKNGYLAIGGNTSIGAGMFTSWRE